MGKNIFFERKGPFLLNDLFINLKLKKKIKIFDIRNLESATKDDLTFLDSIDYINFAKTTRAKYCLTTIKLKDYLPKNCEAVLVQNVLFDLCKVTRKFYPNADIDTPDISLKNPKKLVIQMLSLEITFQQEKTVKQEAILSQEVIR